MSAGDTVTTTYLCKVLGFQVTAGFLSDVLMVTPAGRERNGTNWHRRDIPLICELLAEHVAKVAKQEAASVQA